MRRIVPGIAVLVCCASLAREQQVWGSVYRPFSATYVMYGGGLGDSYAPTAGDRHIAFGVKGQVAKKMFDAMGPDLKSVCGAENGTRVREKDAVSCWLGIGGGYVCDFGFDLTTGKSIGGSVC
jgi:hypothetical protein